MSQIRLGLVSSTTIGAAVIGAVGFMCGFLGPIFIGQMVGVDMAQGPLIGIFFTGPAGLCFGALLGFVCAAMRLSPGSFLAVLMVTALCVAVATLYLCIPDPQYKGTIIVARIHGCRLVSDGWDKAVSAMEREVAQQMKWGNRAYPDWKNMIEKKRSTEKGVVLSMSVIRERKVYERKEPWNLGMIEGSPWIPVNATREYFARFAGGSCNAYTRDPSRKMYFPARERSRYFPPDNVPAFLDLFVLDDVPPAYANLPPRYVE
jgi:hypothetical protein